MTDATPTPSTDNQNSFDMPDNALFADAPRPSDANNVPAIPTDTPSMLRRAAQLMKDGDKEGAKRIVSGVLKATHDNPDAWYLYAHLSDDHAKKVQGLERALHINPQHARAQQMLSSLRSSGDLFADFLPNPTPAPSSVYTAPMSQQPIVYVNVNQQQQNNVGVLAPKVNQAALIIGFIGAAFFGIFGISQLLTGKVGGAIGRFILGIVWIAVAITLTTITAGIGACLTLPLHLFLAYTWSKQGATTTV